MSLVGFLGVTGAGGGEGSTSIMLGSSAGLLAGSDGSAGRGSDVSPRRPLKSVDGHATSAPGAASADASPVDWVGSSATALSCERSELQGSRKPERVSVVAMGRALFLVNGWTGRGLRAP